MWMKPTELFIFLLLIFLVCGYGSETSLQHAVAAIHASGPKSAAVRPTGDAISLRVTATAFTSRISETDKSPSVTAWGDRLKPGMKAIAVSRDLIKMGLTHKTVVTIDGLEGEYYVLDKMHRRWTRKIDIYMGLDRKKAIHWGKRKVIIHWIDKGRIKRL